MEKNGRVFLLKLGYNETCCTLSLVQLITHSDGRELLCCDFCYVVSHRHGGSLSINSQWQTRTLSPKPKRQWILPITMCLTLKENPLSWAFRWDCSLGWHFDCSLWKNLSQWHSDNLSSDLWPTEPMICCCGLPKVYGNLLYINK